MKKFYIPVLIMAAAAMISCEKQSVEKELVEETTPATYTYTLNAGIANAEADVKTDYNASSGTFSWSAGDAISVLFHNGDGVNQFFTLTTTGTGTSATFTGEITSGYEIGASDGDASDKKIWALFPASANHTYTAGSNPTFYVNPTLDFTTSHFSANLPMYDLLSAEGDLSFENLTSAYKFTITNLDASVSKVRVVVSNQTTYGLSGSWPIHTDKYIDYGYASPGSANSCLTFTSNVSSNTASFYVPCRFWGTFQPIISIYNDDNDHLLKTVTAAVAKQPTSLTKVQPITISAPGTGSLVYASSYSIDWDSVTETANGSADPSGIQLIKAYADASKLYLYLEVATASLYDNAAYSHANKMYFYVNDGSAGSSSAWTQGYSIKNSENWLKINNVTVLDSWDSFINSKNIAIYNKAGITILEVAINRSFDTCLQGTSCYVAVDISNQYVESGTWHGSSSTKIGYAPAAGESMLAVTMPTYVAP